VPSFWRVFRLPAGFVLDLIFIIHILICSPKNTIVYNIRAGETTGFDGIKLEVFADSWLATKVATAVGTKERPSCQSEKYYLLISI
jgi:hypothetical protein